MRQNYPQGVRALNQWRKLHPDFKTKLWSEQEYTPLIKKHFPSLARLIRTAQPALPFAFQADAARMAILKEHGGVYCDIDALPIRSVKHLLHGADFVITSLSVSQGERVVMRDDRLLLNNHFIASSKGHALWDTVSVLMKEDRSNWRGPGWPKATSKIVESPFLELLMAAVTKHLHEPNLRMVSHSVTYPSFKSGATKKLIRENIHDLDAVRRLLPAALLVENGGTGQDWRKASALTVVKNSYEYCSDYWLLVLVAMFGLVLVLSAATAIGWRRAGKHFKQLQEKNV